MKIFLITLLYVLSPIDGTVYGFFRWMDRKASIEGTRRVFGGSKADLKQFPQVSLLIDRNGNSRCSSAIIARKFALTAAHCISGDLRYVRYNTRSLTSGSDAQAKIVALYRHPEYKVIQKDEGRGMDVIDLHHDIGLVKTAERMVLRFPLNKDPLVQTRSILPRDIRRMEADVMGFGKTDRSGVIGEELFSVKLYMQPCERSTWVHCICGTAGPGQRAHGVCSGDSGGPVVFEGTQIGVTSMGPMECVSKFTLSPDAPSITSVFTELYSYVDLINSTIHELKDGSKMNTVQLSRAHNVNAVNVFEIFILIISVSFLLM